MKRIRDLKNIVEKPKEYRAKPLKRVWIPKGNTNERRPLGIPTIMDRCVQALYFRAMDPVVEAKSDRKSFGFRKARSCHDAILYRQRLRNGRTGAEYILETDIEKCFDKINHSFLVENTPICHKPVLKQ